MATTCLNLRSRLLTCVFISLTLLSPKTASAATPLFGVFLPVPGTQVNYSNGIANYENWLNNPANPIVAFGPNDSWADLEGSPGQGLGWAVGRYAPPYASRVIWSIPMLPYSGNSAYGNLTDGAAGKYTGASSGTTTYPNYWATVAQTLYNAGYGKSTANGGYGPTTIRLGWEFNGSWFPWCEGGTSQYGLTGTPAQYVSYWKNIVLAMRASEPNATFKFNWCGALGDQYSGSNKNNPDAAFPVADTNGSYVDEVGVDDYDTDPSGNYYPVSPNTWSSTGYNTQAEQNSKHNSNWTAQTTYGTYNLNWWVKEAAGTVTGANQTNALPLTIPEWGLNGGNTQYSEGGGDNPIFIQDMYNFFTKASNNVTWTSYFQQDVSFPSAIFKYSSSTGSITTDFPNATATFTSPSLFGSSTPTVVYPVLTETATGWVNNTAWTGGYGTVTGSLTGTYNYQSPYSGLKQYKIAYTSAAGFQLAFNAQNVSTANHVRLAIRGPVTNSTQTVVLKLTDQSGSYSSQVTLTTSANNNYYLEDIPLSSLTGVDLTKITSLYFYMTANSGTADTFYIDNIEFINE